MKSSATDRFVIDSPSNLLAQASAAGNDFPRGLRLAEQAVTLARRDGAGDEVLGQALLLQAHYAWRLFDYALAYESALDASSVLERCGDERRRSRALNYCFIVCIETGDLVRAIEHSTRALALARADQHPGQRATLLHNQAVVYEMIEDYDTALSCLAESAHLYDGLVQGEPGAFFARVNAAGIHLARADRAAGRADDVQAHRDAARAALPALRADADPAALQMWLSIQSRLGNMAAAREAAVLCIARARANPASERYKTYALLALADYHLGLGRPRRGVACLRRAADKLRAAQNQSHLSATERRLAALYADMGDHDCALHWIRRAHADNTRMQAERHLVRWSFAEADRDEKRRRDLPQEVLVHAQRLDVVGRLIAEIHHALALPLNVARSRLLSLLTDDGAGEPLEQGLSEVIAQVDAAASLVSQLKMFSYRASPQPSEVNPQAALAQAWKDAALWRHGPARELRIDSRVRTAVHVDAQRLAVLLRILLIEADRASTPEGLAASIDTEESMCRMRLATTAQDLQRVSAGVGITLCAEIAGEMGGRLSFDSEPGRGVVFDLRLPLLSNP
jgi:signal transduction histidine kinase